MENITPINVAIIGFGKSAPIFHLPILEYLPHFNVKKIVKRSNPLCEQVAHYPHIDFTCDIDDVLEYDNIDLVIITTPNTTHFDLCKKALLHNKHVVVEKPFTPTYKESMELCKLAKKRDKVLSVYHNRRFDGDFLTIKKIIENGELGRLVEYESHFDRFRNYLIKDAWREHDLEGSGILFDLGSHIIDQALDIFGMPKTVFADIRKQRDNIKVDDSFEVILGYPRLKVTLKATMLCNAPKLRFLLNGTNGSYVKYGTDSQEKALKTGKRIDDRWGGENKEHWGTQYLMVDSEVVENKIPTISGDYRRYYIDIYESITYGKKPMVSAEKAADVIKIIEHAFCSSKLGKIVSIS